MATTTNAADRDIAASFPPESAARCETLALWWHAALLASWAALVHGALSSGVFFLVGLCAFVRNFNALHELSHAPDARRSPLSRLRFLMYIVSSPVQLSYDETAKNHRAHHAFIGDALRDPDAYLNTGKWWRAIVNAATQPEQSLFRWVRQEGWSRRVGYLLAWNCTVITALYYVGGLRGLAFWLALTRVASVAVWFIFDWILHHDRVWGRAPVSLPSAVVPLWVLLFGRDNLCAVQFHALHHRFPYVRDRGLPRLSASLRERSEDGNPALPTHDLAA